MRKKAGFERRRGRSAAAAGAFPASGVTIASGAHVPRIDLDALFRDRPGADSATASLAGVAMTGGGVQMPTVVSHDSVAVIRDTVALPDGTRITFAEADGVRTLEPA
jgi:hypothetical protein